jgi:uncharacterized SAM-binding protein YcdF (DUF218 family)
MIRLALRWTVRVVLAVVVVVVGYLAVTAVQVWLTSRRYDPRHAAAAVVMGSAEYDGVPSADLASRLHEALVLWRERYVPLVIVTGGRKPGDVYTESEVGGMYLEHAGMPRNDVIEVGGTDSWTNVALADRVLVARHDRTVLMVTDPFHEDRSMAIASQLGLEPFPAPTRTSPIKGWSTVPYFAKETVGVALGRLVGYQNLTPFHSWLDSGP